LVFKHNRLYNETHKYLLLLDFTHVETALADLGRILNDAKMAAGRLGTQVNNIPGNGRDKLAIVVLVNKIKTQLDDTVADHINIGPNLQRERQHGQHE